ncbi:hypothetical protein ONS95_011399 [Cadophora gregata]|uniref:uncharacterized protein n=1 Tax=Cadophora gregata TaxID=51156 RepID=UPI0026DB8E9A|nr:uncharacterized protein ONS95_011399 [Cadophora gregata]KAK0119975.1 hypothetical protein ONS95_011399 [Cadophora gregata]KAK0121010.1 hypothetical protein ONS96_011201 [Cadophora gregata f. sp. sojae]
MPGIDSRSVSESVTVNGESTDRMADETRATTQSLPSNAKESHQEKSTASNGQKADGDTDPGASPRNSGASGLDEHKGNEMPAYESPSNSRKRINMKQLSQQLSNGQKPIAAHSNYVSPNGIPHSELGLPYTVVSAITRRQLEANELPPSRRVMFEDNTDPNQGPGYISPDQLYEIRDCTNGKGRGMFAKVNIKKGQLIMFEHALITLYFYKTVIKWSKDIAEALDKVGSTFDRAARKASSTHKSDEMAERPLSMTATALSSTSTSFQPTISEAMASGDGSNNSRKLISKASQTLTSKANRHYDHHYKMTRRSRSLKLLKMMLVMSKTWKLYHKHPFFILVKISNTRKMMIHKL